MELFVVIIYFIKALYTKKHNKDQIVGFGKIKVSICEIIVMYNMFLLVEF